MSDFINRASESLFWRGTKDWAMWDGRPAGAAELNGWCTAVPDIYYFSYSTYKTRKMIFSDRHIPLLGMNPLIMPNALVLGMGIFNRDGPWKYDETWYESDGIVNTICQNGPKLNSEDVIVPFDANNIIPGVWNDMGKLCWDHLQIVGFLSDWAKVKEFYLNHADFLASLPKGEPVAVKVEGSEITLLSKLKMEITTLCDQIPLIWRKDQALKALVDKEKISPEVYEDLHNSFEGVLNQLKSGAQTLIDEIDKETARCAQEIMELNYALVNLEIEHEIGKVDEQSYLTAFTMIQECLKKANTQKSDLEALKNKLSNILLGETPPLAAQEEQEIKTEPMAETQLPEETQEENQTEAPIPQSQSLPEPPVVVYVKEVGESGI